MRRHNPGLLRQATRTDRSPEARSPVCETIAFRLLWLYARRRLGHTQERVTGECARADSWISHPSSSPFHSPRFVLVPLPCSQIRQRYTYSKLLGSIYPFLTFPPCCLRRSLTARHLCTAALRSKGTMPTFVDSDDYPEVESHPAQSRMQLTMSVESRQCRAFQHLLRHLAP